MDVRSEIEKHYGKSIPDHASNLDLWNSWYKGFDSKFHSYKVPQGRGKTINVTRLSMKMGKSASENFANLLVNEKTNVSLAKGDENEHDNELLQKIYERLGFWNRTNVGVEKDFALGSGAGVISIDYKINANTGMIMNDGDWKIHYEFLDAYKVYPLKWRYGECVECAFASFGTTDGAIVLHTLNEKGNYVIATYLYERRTSKEDWRLANDQPVPLETNSPIPLFAYLKPNIANNEDDCEIGISIFANAIDTMKAIDSVYDGYYYEFVLGKKRAFVSSTLATIDENGKKSDVFDENDMGIYVMPIDDDGKSKFNFVEGQLRAEAYSKALNDNLSVFSYQCGFGKGFFSFGGEGGRPIQTATAVMMQNNDLFRSIKKHEIFIDKFITQITQAIMFASTKWTKNKFINTYDDDDIKVIFDDSIFEDKATEKETDRKDVSIGVMSRVQYRKKWYGEDEEQARATLLKNPDYLAIQLNGLMTALTNKAITPKDFVESVWGEGHQDIISYIEEGMKSGGGIPIDDVLSRFEGGAI